MLDSVLDGVAVLAPLVIAIMSVLVGMKLAKDPKDQSHKAWWVAIVCIGIICTAATLWQQARTRNAHSDEVGHLKDSINDLRTDLKTAEAARKADAEDFKQRMDVLAHVPSSYDPKRLAEIVRALANPSDLSNFIAIGKLHEERLKDIIQDYDQFARGQFPPDANLLKIRTHQLHNKFMREYYKDIFAYRTAALARLGRTPGDTLATSAYKNQSEIPEMSSPDDYRVALTRADIWSIREELTELLKELSKLPH